MLMCPLVEPFDTRSRRVLIRPFSGFSPVADRGAVLGKLVDLALHP
jgi:hypothetical protein